MTSRRNRARLTRRRAIGTLLLVGALAGCRSEEASVEPDPTSTATPGLQAPTIPPATPATAPATNTGPLGLKWSWFQPDTFAFVEQARGTTTFAEVEWCDVEPRPGVRSWEEVDRVVSRARDLGYRVMLKLRTGQCWGTEPPDPSLVRDSHEAGTKNPSTMPTDLVAYQSFVSDLVARYAGQGVHDWAVENEIDVANFWVSDLAEYEQLVRLAVPVIRAADPEARLVGPGLSSTSYGVVLAASLVANGQDEEALETYRSYYQRRLGGGASRWPAVADSASLRTVLGSTNAQRSVQAADIELRLSVEGVLDVYQLHFYEPADVLPGVLEWLRDRLGEVPIEAWEYGAAWPGSDYSESVHAEELLRGVAILLAAHVDRIVYLPVAWTPGSRAQVFRGLVEPDGALLPAGQTWLMLAQLTTDLGPPTAISGTLSGVSWPRGTGSAAVVWSTDGSPVPVTFTAGEDVRDATGQPLGADVVDVTGPVLVLAPTPGLGDRLTIR